jgi:hypothetical protein
MINTINAYANITTGTTTQVFTGACTLVAIVVNTTAAGSIKIIDGTSGSTANVGTLKSSVVEGTYLYNISLASGIRIITASASDVTIVYRVH